MLYLLGIATLGVAFSAAAIGWVVSTYRRLRVAESAVAETWAALVQRLEDRHRLLEDQLAGNDEIQQARAEAANAATVAARAKCEQRLTSALRNLPDEGAAFEESDREIAGARQAYNETVMGYNDSLQVWPARLVALAFAVEPATFFEQQDHTSREIPRIEPR